jgi:hypothetical protein
MQQCIRQIHKTALFFYTHVAPFVTESVLTVADISVLIIEASAHKYKSYTNKDFFLLLMMRFCFKRMVGTYNTNHAIREVDFHKN